MLEAAVLEAKEKGEASALTSSATVSPTSSAPLLSEEIANHIADLVRRKLSADTITESKHTLRLLLVLIGDVPVDTFKAPHFAHRLYG